MEELVVGNSLLKLQQKPSISPNDNFESSDSTDRNSSSSNSGGSNNFNNNNKWLLCTKTTAAATFAGCCLNHRKGIAIANLSSPSSVVSGGDASSIPIGNGKKSAKTVSFPKTIDKFNQQQQVKPMAPQHATSTVTLFAVCVSILMPLMLALSNGQVALGAIATGGSGSLVSPMDESGNLRATPHSVAAAATEANQVFASTLDRLKLLERQLEMALNGRHVSALTQIAFPSSSYSSSSFPSSSSSSSWSGGRGSTGSGSSWSSSSQASSTLNSNSDNISNLDKNSYSSPATTNERKRRMLTASISAIAGGGGGGGGLPHQQLFMSPLDQMTAIESLNSLLDDDNPSRLGRAYKPKSMSTARGFGKRSGGLGLHLGTFGVGRRSQQYQRILL